MDGDRDSSVKCEQCEKLQAELSKAHAELATLRADHASLSKGFAETSAAWRRLVKTLG